MNRKHLYITGIIVNLAVALLLTGCSSDSDQDSRPMRDVNLMLGTHTYTDVTEPLTRAWTLPADFVPFAEMDPRVSIDFATIRAFMTHGISIDFQGDFTYRKVDDNYVWNSKVPLDEGTYYVYGFMPSSEASKVGLAPLTGAYSNGATMTISGLPAVTSYDPCVIVGVKSAPNNTEMPDMSGRLGYYDFNADKTVTGGGEYIYLLIDHLYAAMRLNLKIDDGYSALRKIKITKLTLKAKQVKSADLTVTMKHGDASSLNTIGIKPTSGTEGDEVAIYDGAEKELEVSTPLGFMACILPIVNTTDNRRFEMKTTYNVYDRYDNLIGERTAVNALTFANDKTLTRGQYYTFNLTVKPTYIYVLSEPDLDNPEITITN